MIYHHGICSYCYKTIQKFNYCGKCGNSNKLNVNECKFCKISEPLWDQIVLVSSYQQPLITLLNNYKFYKNFWYDRALARLLYLSIADAKRNHSLILPEIMIPIPLSHMRTIKRGYNQSLLLAKYLNRWLNIPIDKKSLQRIKHSKPQSQLNARERKINIKNVFTYNNKLQHYSSVALIDDIMTTGATLREACLELRKKDIQNIQVWVICKT